MAPSEPLHQEEKTIDTPVGATMRFTCKGIALIPPFLFLYFWFRLEVFLHNHSSVLLVSVVISWGLIWLLWFFFRSKSRVLFVFLWTVITALITMDYIQLRFLSQYSESSFESKVDRSARAITERAQQSLQRLKEYSGRVESHLRKAENGTDLMFVELQEALSKEQDAWAIYAGDGSLQAWDHGKFPSRETVLGPELSETSVVSVLHQNQFKFKRAVSREKEQYQIVVYRTFAADYGVENRYLRKFNILTDGLSVRPDLLYNSPQITAPSAGYVVRRVELTPDFFISLLYSKKQYDEYFAAGVFNLHWWLEFAVLLFFLLGGTHLFFEFIRYSGKSTSGKTIFMYWLILALASLLCVFSVRYYSSFAMDTVFLVQDSEPMRWGGVVQSPGGLIITSFFAFNLTLALALMLRRTGVLVNWGNRWFYFVLIFFSFLASGLILTEYLKACSTILPTGAFDPASLSLYKQGVSKISQMIGTLWLDLTLVILISIFYVLLIRQIPRNFKVALALAGAQLIATALIYRLQKGEINGGWIGIYGLYCGIGLLAYFLPLLSGWFGRLNFLSRFFIVLLLCSVVSFVFHSTRFHFAAGWHKEFIQREVAPEVINQRTRARQLLLNSQEELDRALLTTSLDPKISDLAFRLWCRTDLARYGYKSAIEIFDEDGVILNRFSVGLPRLAIPWEGLLESTTWFLEERMVPFGTARKPVLISVRNLSNRGYLVVEAVIDYENLPFVPASSPFQELFKPVLDSRLFGGTPLLYIYDQSWRPIFLSRPDLSPSTVKGKELLQTAAGAWSKDKWDDQSFHVYYFRLNDGHAAFLIPEVAWRTHVVHLLDLLLLNLLWLSCFVLLLTVFVRSDMMMHFHAAATTRFNFFQKILFALVVFSMVPMLSLSWLIRNYVWQKQFQEVSNRALNSFAVATRVVGDYLSYRVEEQDPRLFSNELLEWISQVIQQDVSFYYDRYLLATSNREFYSAGLLSEQIQGKIYVDLFLKGQKFSIDEMQISHLKLLNVSGRIHTGRFRDEVISIPFLIDEQAVESEVTSLREYMMIVGGGVVLFAVLFGYFIASRFSKPVVALIRGTGEMSRGNLQYRIRARYQDEFQQLVTSFNTMAASLDEQQGALERRRAYIENILKNITTAVISIDRTMIITTINPAAEQMFGMDPSKNASLREVISGSGSWMEAGPYVEKFLDRKEEFQKKEVSFYRDNQEFHWRLVFVPLFEDQEWNGAVLLVEDITDIIRSNRLSAWAEMARRVAHEVKNPLTPIQLAVEHLVRVYQDHSENFGDVLKSCSDAVLKQVKNLRRLVSEFSQYGRPQVLNRRQIEIKPFLKEIVSSYEKHLPDGIRMEVSIAEDLPSVNIDPEKLQGALLNIIENGLQATGGQGLIRIHAGMKNHDLVLQIQDTGAGIPEEIIPRLFEPYFSTKSGGTGLGLAIARKNIEDHGGRIEVESSTGKGTTVTILLPMEEKRPAIVQTR